MNLQLQKIALIVTAIAPTFANAQIEQTIDKARRSGVFTISYRDASIPFSYLDDKGKPVGFTYDICRRIADEVKKATGRADMRIDSQLITSANRIPLLLGGTIDIECGSTTNNAERAKQVDFAINYFYTGTRFLTKSGSHVRSIDDLRGKTVVSPTGTTNLRIIRNLNEEKNLNIDLIGAKDHAEAALMVGSGRAVAFAMDDILLYGIKAAMPNPGEWEVDGDPIQVEPYAIMIRKGDIALKNLVDGTLSSMMKSGEFEKLYSKWFESAIPPKGINLHVPMSAELRANLTALSDKPAR